MLIVYFAAVPVNVQVYINNDRQLTVTKTYIDVGIRLKGASVCHCDAVHKMDSSSIGHAAQTAENEIMHSVSKPAKEVLLPQFQKYIQKPC